MNWIRVLIFAILLLTTHCAYAQLEQDRMITTSYNVMILSSFDNENHITAYNENGNLLWDVVIYPHVLSWKLKDGYLYVFSKSRHLNKTYLTCIDPSSGYIAWERP